MKPGTLPPLRFILLRLSAQRTNPARRGGGRGDPEAACPENYFFSFAFFSFNLSGAARQLREAKAELFLKEREIQARARARAPAGARGVRYAVATAPGGSWGETAAPYEQGQGDCRWWEERNFYGFHDAAEVFAFVGFFCLTARGRCRSRDRP